MNHTVPDDLLAPKLPRELGCEPVTEKGRAMLGLPPLSACANPALISDSEEGDPDKKQRRKDSLVAGLEMICMEDDGPGGNARGERVTLRSWDWFYGLAWFNAQVGSSRLHRYDPAAWHDSGPASIDPKGVEGAKKCQMQLLPPVALREMANALNYGANIKCYGVRNWVQGDGVEAMTYQGAILRHLMAWTEGEDLDPESGVSHLAHIMAGCAIMLDADSVGKLVDNRPGKERP